MFSKQKVSSEKCILRNHIEVDYRNVSVGRYKVSDLKFEFQPE